jgi:hypothetical protein
VGPRRITPLPPIRSSARSTGPWVAEGIQRTTRRTPAFWSSSSAAAFAGAPITITSIGRSARAHDRWSTLATSFAVVIGSRSITRQMPLAMRSLLVAAAAAVSATNRSYAMTGLSGFVCEGRQSP